MSASFVAIAFFLAASNVAVILNFLLCSQKMFSNPSVTFILETDIFLMVDYAKNYLKFLLLLIASPKAKILIQDYET